jgi:hypothetical protein
VYYEFKKDTVDCRLIVYYQLTVGVLPDKDIGYSHAALGIRIRINNFVDKLMSV